MKSLKSLGWHFFTALLLADILAIIMLKLMVKLNVVILIGALVFVILLVIMIWGHHAKKRIKKREDEAITKIAELEDKVKEKVSSAQ